MVALEDSDFSVLGDSIDLNQVSAVPLGDTVGYVKQATLVMIQHLNKFSLAAEERLRQISSSISRLETELTILESKLASIPGLESIKVVVATSDVPGEPAGTTLAPGPPKDQGSPAQNQLPAPSPSVQPNVSVPTSSTPTVPSTPAVAVTEAPAPTPETNLLTVKMDPIYARYFKMILLGVPTQAVRLKMQSEGVDPSLLDTPNAPSPSGNLPPQDDIDDAPENSASDDDSD